MAKSIKFKHGFTDDHGGVTVYVQKDEGDITKLKKYGDTFTVSIFSSEYVKTWANGGDSGGRCAIIYNMGSSDNFELDFHLIKPKKYWKLTNPGGNTNVQVTVGPDGQ